MLIKYLLLRSFLFRLTNHAIARQMFYSWGTNLRFLCITGTQNEGKYAGVQTPLSRYNPVKGLFDSWLTPDLYREGGALL
jgi:hypothetical protein